LIEFDWDEDNESRILLQGRATPDEIEEVFYNRPEVRRKRMAYIAKGRTDAGRQMFVVFVWRDDRIRPYSARELTKNEKKRLRG
jgi:uncharacterized DUF497 family protein